LLRRVLVWVVHHAAGPIVIDLSGLDFCDVRSMSLLTTVGGAVNRAGGGYASAGLTGAVAHLWRAAGFAGSLLVHQLAFPYPTAAQAVTAIVTGVDRRSRPGRSDLVIDLSSATPRSHSAGPRRES
jgi:hypothetical protein